MSNNIREKAKRLAAQRYTTRIIVDDSEPEQTLYVALHPELEGCVAQGKTIEDARANLNEFRVDYLEHLLEHHLPIP